MADLLRKESRFGKDERMVHKILIIDDDSGFTRPLKDFFERSGSFKVQVENRAEYAVEASKKFQPEVILLDILMPKLNGLQISELLKKEKMTAMIPVVMLSALTSPEEKLKATQLYGDCYVEKPVELDQLLSQVEAVLKRSGRA